MCIRLAPSARVFSGERGRLFQLYQALESEVVDEKLKYTSMDGFRVLEALALPGGIDFCSVGLVGFE